MTYEEMRDRKLLIEADLASIHSSIDAARQRHAETGEDPEPDWLRRVEYARRACGWESQAIAVHMGRKKREEAAARAHQYTQDAEERQQEKAEARRKANLAFERAFVDAAKEILPRETFNTIKQAAFREVDIQ